jgi:crotonobetainyl-CoA:carnitine CoA-transferase CaiB-like acyl-CoA transferase
MTRTHYAGTREGGLLDGMRVVDVTEGIAGAYAAKLLADQGASVTKIERAGGDPLRRWSAATPDAPLDPEQPGPLFRFLHAGTDRHLSIDDDAELDAALAHADVVIADDGSRVMVDARAGSAPLVTISAFGADGPLAGAPADEFTLQAWCGLMSGCGTPETPPLQMGAGHGLWATGAMAALAALAARTWHARTGTRTDIEVTALEVMAVCLTNYPPLYCHFTGNPAMMSRGGDWPQIVRCKDGWIGLCVFTPQQWADFAGMIGRDDLAADERLNSMGGRGRNRELAYSVVRPWIEQHTAAEIHELGGLFRVPVAFVGNGRDVLDMSHFVERGVFEDHGDFVAPRSPLLVETVAVGDAPARAPDSGAAPSRPLDGVRVIDLTAFWAGPAATHLLATLGADVVKIESPSRPDGMRFATTRPPTHPSWVEYSPTFHGTNPAKRSVTIDFSSAEGRELVLRLVEHADVVVENFTPRVLPNVGLDDDALRARRPDLVLLRMPAFGLDGPWRDHSGFAQTTEQVSGIAWLTGTRDIDPQVRSTVDPIAGIHGAFAVLAALDHRRRTGEGARLELPMAEVALNVAAEPIVTWSASGVLLERDGNRGPRGAPQSAYACAGEEQWLALTIGSDGEWARLIEVLGSPGWAMAPDLSTAAGRRMRHDEIDRHLGAWFAVRERDTAVAALLAAGVRAAAVWDQNTQDALPQLAERGFTQLLEHPIAGPVGYPGTGMRASAFALAYRAAAPTVGQHTDDVLRDVLGLTDEEIGDLARRGITAPA